MANCRTAAKSANVIAERKRNWRAWKETERLLKSGIQVEDVSGRLKAETDAFDREIELTQKNKELMELLASRANQTNTASLEDARKLLGLE